MYEELYLSTYPHVSVRSFPVNFASLVSFTITTLCAGELTWHRTVANLTVVTLWSWSSNRSRTTNRALRLLSAPETALPLVRIVSQPFRFVSGRFQVCRTRVPCGTDLLHWCWYKTPSPGYIFPASSTFSVVSSAPRVLFVWLFPAFYSWRPKM
jgi:hypothetical protein